MEKQKLSETKLPNWQEENKIVDFQDAFVLVKNKDYIK